MQILGESMPAGGGAPSCGSSSTCEATGTRVEKVLLLDGLREVEIIEDCHCEAKVMSCLRAPALKTYFFETPYETVIDVGKCVGSKGELGKKAEIWMYMPTDRIVKFMSNNIFPNR